ncbi:MAG: hypothetical protein ACI9P7_002534 [Candidatus Azotimanducaceae bacterium]|jgi:hypothetical protein
MLEAELKDSLVPHLRNAVDGNNDFVFCVKTFNELREFRDRADEVTEELIEIGSQILSLREKLGEPTDGTIAERICWYCRQWSKTQNHQSASSEGLARQFLAEIEKAETEKH